MTVSYMPKISFFSYDLAYKNTNNVLFSHINSFKGIILEFSIQLTYILLNSHAIFCKDWPSIYGDMAPDSSNK